MRATAQGPEDVSLDHLEEGPCWEGEVENVNVGGSLHRSLNRLVRQCRLAMARPLAVRAVIQIDSSIHLVKEALPRDTNQWFITGCRNACGRADVSSDVIDIRYRASSFALAANQLRSILFQPSSETALERGRSLWTHCSIFLRYSSSWIQSLIAFSTNVTNETDHYACIVDLTRIHWNPVSTHWSRIIVVFSMEKTYSAIVGQHNSNKLCLSLVISVRPLL